MIFTGFLLSRSFRVIGEKKTKGVGVEESIYNGTYQNLLANRLPSPCLEIRTLCENNKERRYCFSAKILKYFVPYSVVSKENTDSLSHTQTNDKQMNSVVKFIE